MMMHINSDRFHYHKDDKEFSAFLSDFNNLNFNLERVFPDACDVGFTMISDKTGTELIFILDNEINRNDEVEAWEFNAYSKDPIVKDITVVIFND